MKLTRDHVGERTMAKLMADAPDWVPRPQVYGGHGLTCIIAREQMGGLETGPLRWHISVAGPNRVPTWEEMVEVAHSPTAGRPVRDLGAAALALDERPQRCAPPA